MTLSFAAPSQLFDATEPTAVPARQTLVNSSKKEKSLSVVHSSKKEKSLL